MKTPDWIIDANERGPLKESILRLSEKAGLQVAEQPLIVGDYLLGQSCVEAKSISDFFQSSYSGHLWRQLENMDSNYSRSFLVIHGDIAKHVRIMKNKGQKHLTYPRVLNQLMGTFARIMADFDCHIYKAKDHNEAAMFITKLHSKLHKPASKHGAQAIRRVSTNDIRMDMLLTIPGIGPELAEKLLERCGNIEEMAYGQSLKDVRGLGKTLRKRLVDVLTSEDPVKIERRKKI